jgi:hypothetical protein
VARLAGPRKGLGWQRGSFRHGRAVSAVGGWRYASGSSSLPPRFPLRCEWKDERSSARRLAPMEKLRLWQRTGHVFWCSAAPTGDAPVRSRHRIEHAFHSSVKGEFSADAQNGDVELVDAVVLAMEVAELGKVPQILEYDRIKGVHYQKAADAGEINGSARTPAYRARWFQKHHRTRREASVGS